MARNGSGTYAKVNTFTAGNSITASGHNENWDDAGAEITNSVAADGQTSMTGPLKAHLGSVAAPSVTFSADADTGIYRIGANNAGFACAGAKVLDISTTGLDVTGTVTQNGGQAPGIIGEVKIYAGSSAPTGWLLCYGQAISRTTYAALFAVISTTYGTGDGSTTFNVPDLRGRVIAGVDNMGGSAASRLTSTYFGASAALGAVGGAESHTLTTTEMPSHSHTITDAGHTHNVGYSGSGAGGGSGAFVDVQPGASGNKATASATTGITVNTNGSGGAHAIVQPSIQLNYIIKT